MRVLLGALQIASAAVATILVAGCGGNPGPPITGSPPFESAAARSLRHSFKEPALLALEPDGALAYAPIRPRGGSPFTPLSDKLDVFSGGMAANGNVVIIASYKPAKIVTYNVKTKAVATMGDPYGAPEDVAVGKNGTIYAMNNDSVAVYKPGSKRPSELTCGVITESQAIAVNNQGDVFVAGYPSSSPPGMVVEYAAGSTSCMVPRLRPSEGYIAGVGVDPKTDDLIVIDNPDYCAGGLEGRMTIYSKPYERRHSVRHILETNYCAGTFRLDAASMHIFYADATVSDGFPLIDQARYPSGRFEGQYHTTYFPSGVSSTGFTTIPNTLPN